MKKKTKFLLLLLLVLLSSCVSSDRIQKYNSYQEDLLYLYNSLASNHVHFFNSMSSQKARDFLDAILPTVKDGKSLFIASLEITAISKDSHTAIYPTDKILQALSVIPFNTTYLDGKFYITSSGNELYKYLGYELIGIGGKDIREVVEDFTWFLSSDNDIYRNLIYSSYSNIADIYKVLGLTNGENIELSLRNKSGQTVNIKAPIKSSKKYLEGVINNLDLTLPETFTSSLPYYFEIIEPNIFYLQYNQCREDMEYPMVLFSEDVKNNVLKADKIILDFRFNGGGNSLIFQPIIDIISENIREDQTLIILIGTNTFSSAILNVNDIKNKVPSTILVGMPTGGSVSHYGELGMGKLPRSEMVFTYSTKFFDNNGDIGTSILPDYYVPITLNDLESGIDAALNYAINL